MKVVVCTDFSAASAAGEREAARRFSDDELVVVHALEVRLLRRVVDATGLDKSKLRQAMSAHADQRLHEIIERLLSEGRRAVAELTEGEPVDAVLQVAARHGAGLIVVGARPGVAIGRFRTLLCRRARVPVLIVPAEA